MRNKIDRFVALVVRGFRNDACTGAPAPLRQLAGREHQHARDARARKMFGQQVRGATAPFAGKSIHTDFQQKFIRAEVVAYEKLVEAGSFAKPEKRLGTHRRQGIHSKKDGDVIEFLI